MGKIEKSLILNSYIRRRKCNEKTEVCEKKKKQEALRRVSIILRKCETVRTSEEKRILESATDIVTQIIKRKNRQLQSKERVLEKEDPPDVIEAKARELAEVISRARHLVCYTGAGISTSARIPDYRGSQGIWTLLQQGKDIGQHDLSLAEPTYTHMALYELHRRNILRYVLSQNCDGLHLRSGLPRKSLSEVHGNMYVEVCKTCKPNVEYWRLFDTTELTARYYHKTNRRCHLCGTPLIDTIVHFGERGSLKWPLNWDGAIEHADKADVILCIGSSLKVLKKYPWLWSMERPKNKRPKIYIVNLQWTPKDATATMKINGKCDEVMNLVMKHMKIVVPDYDRQRDPIFAHASLLAPEELHTRSQPMLQGHKDKSEKCDEENDCKGGVSENGCDESKAKPLPDLKLLNGTKDCVVSNEIVDNESHVDLSCDRLMMNLQGENTLEKGTDVEAIVKNSTTTTPVEHRDIQQTSPEKIPTNGSVSLTNGTSLNGNGCYEEENQMPNDLCSEINCDKKSLIPSPPLPPSHPSLLQLPPSSSPIIPVSTSSIVAENGGNDVNCKLPQIPHSDHTINTSSSIIKSPSRTKFTSTDVCLLNNHKDLFCKVPHWYDVNYAYSGLHSIIYPPPIEVDLWSQKIIPLYQMNRSDAECDFCFDNYAEYNCQFYRPKTTDFLVTSCRKGRVILCECCDYTDESDSENTLDCNDAKRAKLDSDEFIKDDKESVKIQAGWYGKGYRKMFRKKRRA